MNPQYTGTSLEVQSGIPTAKPSPITPDGNTEHVRNLFEQLYDRIGEEVTENTYMDSTDSSPPVRLSLLGELSMLNESPSGGSTSGSSSITNLLHSHQNANPLYCLSNGNEFTSSSDGFIQANTRIHGADALRVPDQRAPDAEANTFCGEGTTTDALIRKEQQQMNPYCSSIFRPDHLTNQGTQLYYTPTLTSNSNCSLELLSSPFVPGSQHSFSPCASYQLRDSTNNSSAFSQRDFSLGSTHHYNGPNFQYTDHGYRNWFHIPYHQATLAGYKGGNTPYSVQSFCPSYYNVTKYNGSEGIDVIDQNHVPATLKTTSEESLKMRRTRQTYRKSPYLMPSNKTNCETLFSQIDTTAIDTSSRVNEKYYHIDIESLSRLLPRVPQAGAIQWLDDRLPPFQPVCIVSKYNPQLSTMVSRIQLRLRDLRIWSELYKFGTEMIATNTGRRVFPSLSLDVFGLDSAEDYVFVLDMVMVHPHVYKHQGGQWLISIHMDEDKVQEIINGNAYVQEESPKPGAYWMEFGVNFSRVKITNNKQIRNNSMIHVYSMRHYIPRFSIIRLKDERKDLDANVHQTESQESNEPSRMIPKMELVGSYIIPGTQFHTVTAYQNPDVIRVKIDNNPFAKGFRNRQSSGMTMENLFISTMNASTALRGR